MNLNTPAERIGAGLVAVQFVAMGLLGTWAAPAYLAGVAPVGAWLVGAASVGLGAWALSSNRPGNFNIRPTPRTGGRLVQGGPYRWIRHPMYTAVLGYGLACAWPGQSIAGWTSLAVLTLVLIAKSVLEERWMLIEHPDYAAYRKGTWRFLPGLP